MTDDLLFDTPVPVQPEGDDALNLATYAQRAYLEYALSVVKGRALPDVTDGQKPVQRRILYSMSRMGLGFGGANGNTAAKPVKCARVVGDVLGRFHPHGDSSVYDAAVRMAQDFSLRYPLVDGQGNFGSVDGDSPAAMRYTEIRLRQLSNELLTDLDKETVNMVPNYNDEFQEPTVLPSKFPNLLINGSTGIAVGMATNIPPHNLSEVIDGIIAVIHNPEISYEELLEYVPGPDFPTGATIYGRQGIRDAYATGRGIIQIRAKAHIEAAKKSERQSIVVTEIPYQVNKARLIEKIAELVKEKKVEGITEIRDESDREGMRIVIEVKRDENAEVLLNQLYKHTQLQTSFGINMLAIVHNRPKVLSLREMMDCFVEHRCEVVTRRTNFELKKALARAHILEGLKIALDWLDAVIELIRESKTPPEAKLGLMEGKFADPEYLKLLNVPRPDGYEGAVHLSDIQAQAILEMRLQRLTGLERDKIIAEYEEILRLIARLREILASDTEIRQIIVGELTEIRDRFGDKRRSEIADQTADISLADTIEDAEMVVTVSHTGYIKRSAVELYRAQRRGGKGKTGMKTREEDFVEQLFIASTKDFLLFFTDMGRVYRIKVYEIPEGSRTTKGKAVVNLVNVQEGEKVTAIMPVKDLNREDLFLFMATKSGVVKKTPLMEYTNIRVNGINAVNLDEGDKLITVALTDGQKDIFLASRQGKAIRFPEADARPMGRVTRGVRGMNLDKGDEVIGMEVVDPTATGSTIFTMTENGFGKRTDLDEYRGQSRGGKGLITIKTSSRNGLVVGVMQVADENQLMVITDQGKILRVSVGGFSVIGRNTQGVRVMVTETQEKIVAVAKLAERDDDEGLETEDEEA